MNIISKRPIDSIGYNFIAPAYIPKGKDEYHLRNQQNNNSGRYRGLTAHEIEALVRNNNSSDDWNKLLVSEAFNPELVKNCKFFGLVRIGKLEPWYLEFHNLRMPVGLYNSTIISCDLGDNIVVDNVNYLSHYIIGHDVMIVNVNELATTSTAKFGNGILKEGEKEQSRIWLEVCNENGGRRILPFSGMLPGDAYMWAKYRDDALLMERFQAFTEKQLDHQRGYYGMVGDRTVIKNCKIVKDVWIGSDAYLKGANKIKNVTIHSAPQAKSQVGEGCELVNGIIGLGCRVFYGVKAVRFFMASHSQLKYGARLINSYLGNNSTISCCEVLNSLIYPFHEQHHNNSFLCASLVMGQSNMAAGATIGSNHNSRANDGEMVAGRGFWPGLCVSLKHNSKFASFTILAKGDYPVELNIPLPFSLVSQDLSKDVLQVMPGYWFMYNLYGLCRNEWKYGHRDLRLEKMPYIETDFLAPDSVNEMVEAMAILETAVGRALLQQQGRPLRDKEALRAVGKDLLIQDPAALEGLEVIAEGFENSRRKVVLLKVATAYRLYQKMIRLYGMGTLLSLFLEKKPADLAALRKLIPHNPTRDAWVNIGGQLMPETVFEKLRTDIKNGRIKNWTEVHRYYALQSEKYLSQKAKHAAACLNELGILSARTIDRAGVQAWINETQETQTWLLEGIITSRKKDYQSSFRKMLYGNDAEMDAVMGRLEDNAFIQARQEALRQRQRQLRGLISKLN